MSYTEIKSLLLQIAKECARNGSGWAQEGVVLREVTQRLAEERGEIDLKTQQVILNAWHDLFDEKMLSWGYDLDNPGSPFFHVRGQSRPQYTLGVKRRS